MKFPTLILGLLRIPIDFLMAIMAFIGAYFLRGLPNALPFLHLYLDRTVFPPLEEYFSFAIGTSIILLILLALTKNYSFKKEIKFSQEIGNIVLMAMTWFMLIIAYFFILRQFPFSRLVLGYTLVFTIILITCGRGILRAINYILLKNNIGRKKIAFVGWSLVAEKIAPQLAKNVENELVGYINPAAIQKTDIPYLGKVSDLSTFMNKLKIEEIIQISSELSDTESTDILQLCREHHVIYRFIPDILTVHQTNIDVETKNGIPIITLKPTPLDGWGRVIKRLFDLLGAIVGLILLSPVFLIITIAIKLDSKGTALFKYLDNGKLAKRVGQQGKLFYCYKFRTMHPNTHALRYTALAGKNTRKGSPLVKIKDDPRVTKVGKFLRSTSLDELPQLINVLKGEMSLVGPRPHLPEEVANYEKHHKFVLTIKPGISGITQVSGRSDLNFEEEVRLDTYYIEHWSLWLDIKILAKTLLVPFKKYNE